MPSGKSLRRGVVALAGIVVLGGGAAFGYDRLGADDPAPTTSTAAAGPSSSAGSSAAAGDASSTASATTSPAPRPKPPPRPVPLRLPAGAARAIPQDEALWRVSTTKGLVALTFDDGPGQYTPRIAAILARHHAHATFFVIGRQIGARPATLRALVQAGHAIGNHTWDHKDLRGLDAAAFRAQVYTTSGAIRDAVGGTPTLLRPPYGGSGRAVDARIRRAGMVPVLWSCDPKDYAQPGAKVIVRRVLACVHAGSIVLLHDGGGTRKQEIAALGPILAGLKKKGLRSVTIPELLAAGTPSTTPATF